MHPAPSVILFTSLSGLGFGLLAWLGLGKPDFYGFWAFTYYFIGYALAVGGLIFSVFHLGNPKNAPKAFSQWRTSWLSREAVLSVVALLTVAVYAIGRIFFDTALPTIGVIGSALCLITVFSTSMIYAQLKTIPRWNRPMTPVLFLLYAVTGGALLAGQVRVAIWLLCVLAVLQVVSWWQGDGKFSSSGSTRESATGLGRIGKVRLLESPHSGSNYLLKEMVHQIGRKHAQKLRVISVILLGILPVGILLAFPGHAWASVAVISHLLGVFASHWLFFAEAEHVVRLYYGK